VIVGMLRVVLAIPEARSLKDKRSVVRRVLDRSRAKFNVAAAEVGMMDVHRRAELGFTLVSNEHRHMQSMLDHLTSFVANASDALVEERSFLIEHRSDLAESGRALDRDLRGYDDGPSGDEP
jgi:hypothetical protein